jgi:O-antigen/teichoic acid export membrane protein
MTREEVPLGAPDTYALRRRVLLVGLIALLLFLVTSYTIAWLEVDDAWLLIAMALLYLAVIRPLMRPVREAIQLRRRLAYDAWLEERDRRAEEP